MTQFRRTDLVVCSQFREGNIQYIQSYSGINTVHNNIIKLNEYTFKGRNVKELQIHVTRSVL